MNKQPIYQHAIVIGGSIAGLAAARVLTDHCERVTIIERDIAATAKQFRKGVPQARHPHVLLKGGELALEGLFPGLIAELYARGAEPVNMGADFDWFSMGAWRQKFPSAIVTIACSRPLLESSIRDRVAKNPNVTIVQESEVVGLLLDETHTRVTGVQLRARNGEHALSTLTGTLVVDASGRDSDTPRWLEALGFPAPRETSVTSKPGYASRLYAIPQHRTQGWKAMYVQPSAPNLTRGAVIVPMEGDRWHVTMFGMAGDYPPTTEDGFLEFAQSLPDPRVYEAIKDAEPLTDVWSFRRGENRLRHYDQLQRYIEGFIVFGDAVYALNPVYGQGMTVAALGALELDRCLQAQKKSRADGDLSGLAKHFQQQLARVIAGPWQMATGEDRRWNVDEHAAPPDFVTRMLQNYIGKVLQLALIDTTVTETFFHVQHMIAPPTLLFRKDILWKVLTTRTKPMNTTKPDPLVDPRLATRLRPETK